MKRLFLLVLLISLPFIVFAAPSAPTTAINHKEKTCFTFPTGDECGTLVAPDNWEADYLVKCPVDYKILEEKDWPKLTYISHSNDSEFLKSWCPRLSVKSYRDYLIVAGGSLIVLTGILVFYFLLRKNKRRKAT